MSIEGYCEEEHFPRSAWEKTDHHGADVEKCMPCFHRNHVPNFSKPRSQFFENILPKTDSPCGSGELFKTKSAPKNPW